MNGSVEYGGIELSSFHTAGPDSHDSTPTPNIMETRHLLQGLGLEE